MPDIEYSVIMSDVIKSFDCMLHILDARSKVVEFQQFRPNLTNKSVR